MSQEIPHIIHYCWFGGNPLPRSAQRCIKSWQKYFPDWEIRRCDESNFDVNAIPYTAQAYAARKYAYVSDYARFKLLYDHGGVYFDTDVEVVKPFDALLADGPFMGIEKSLATNGADPDAHIGVNPGLGIGAPSGMAVYRQILDKYESMDFNLADGTVVRHTTDTLKDHGLANANERQSVAGITIYPDRVLCPMDSTTGLTDITPDTVSIHHYDCSWIDHNTLSWRLHKAKNLAARLLGRRAMLWITSLKHGK